MKIGKVFLVGAGPGDERLITVYGLECIKKADVIVYDRLINKNLLKYKKPSAELIYCGKIPGHHALIQDQIHAIIKQKAYQGKMVIRLKGGDPFVFGRGGEEAELLAKHHIPFEIVPGITSGIAASAYAGIPVTHRDYASSFAIVTGHGRSDQEQNRINWESLTGIDTVAFYMGVGNLHYICEQLIAHGKEGNTPVAVIQWGTTEEQKTVTGTLITIEQEVQKAAITHPAIILVGQVVQLREKLQWINETYDDVGTALMFS